MAAPVEQYGADGTVDVTFKDDVALLTMNCGENRFNELFVEKMHLALDTVLRNPKTKALITTSTGKFYSNGLDLPWLAYMRVQDEARLQRFMKQGYRSVFFRILTFPLPTVSLINGHAFAAGAMLSAAHDHVIMQDARGWWCCNEVHIKLRFHPSMIEFFRSRLQSGRPFHEAIVLGRRFTGEEAMEAGIAHEICRLKDMLPRALTWIKHIIPSNGLDREHLQTMKEDVYKNVLKIRFVEHDIRANL